MSAEDQDDWELRAAIAASLGDSNGSSNNESNRPQPVVDLTGDSEDDDVVPVFPKSHSVIGSETDSGAATESGNEEDGQENGNDNDNDENEDEDEDLKRAIALSLQESRGNDTEPKQTEAEHTKPDATAPLTNESSKPEENQTPQPTGIFGLDRKKMEEERLERLAKRKAGRSTSMESREPKQSRTAHTMKPTGEGSTVHTKPAGDGKNVSQPTSVPSIQFPDGVVKKTWVFNCPRAGDDIKIEEVFQKSDLELAVLSSFMWDMEWLFTKLDTQKNRFYLIMQAKEESTRRQYESETADMPNLRLCFPPMEPQVNCMHSKLMLLFHPGYLRIVVPTANLVPFDWGAWGGIMENMVFLIDLPKKKEQPSYNDSKTTTEFYKELVYFLKASTLHENVISKLDNFDFSKTESIAFVHTIGGSHDGDSWRRTGYCGLGRSIDSLGLHTSKPINIDFVTSSLGSLTDEFLRSIYLAAQGDDGTTEYLLRTSKSFPIKNPSNPQTLVHKDTAKEWKDRFRVYFPSREIVDLSLGGTANAGTICFQSRWYDGAKFPRHVLRECDSTRENVGQKVLMHNKLIYVRPDEPISLPNNSTCRGWAYVGSANLSESAWGRLVKDRTTKQPKLNCRNWECGVLLPVIDKPNPQSAEQAQASSTEATPESRAESASCLDVFKNVVPVPMRLPGSLFGPDKRPWFSMEM